MPVPPESESPGGAAPEPTPPGNAAVDGAKACPSGPCQEGAILLGVMTQDGTLAYVQPPTRVDAGFVARAKGMGRPESRFRFSVPCIEAGCPQWTGKGCAVVDTNDPKALFAWAAEWSEFLPLETTPVLEDADAGAVLGGMFK